MSSIIEIQIFGMKFFFVNPTWHSIVIMGMVCVFVLLMTIVPKIVRNVFRKWRAAGK